MKPTKLRHSNQGNPLRAERASCFVIWHLHSTHTSVRMYVHIQYYIIGSSGFVSYATLRTVYVPDASTSGRVLRSRFTVDLTKRDRISALLSPPPPCPFTPNFSSSPHLPFDTTSHTGRLASRDYFIFLSLHFCNFFSCPIFRTSRCKNTFFSTYVMPPNHLSLSPFIVYRKKISEDQVLLSFYAPGAVCLMARYGGPGNYLWGPKLPRDQVFLHKPVRESDVIGVFRIISFSIQHFFFFNNNP